MNCFAELFPVESDVGGSPSVIDPGNMYLVKFEFLSFA